MSKEYLKYLDNRSLIDKNYAELNVSEEIGGIIKVDHIFDIKPDSRIMFNQHLSCSPND